MARKERGLAGALDELEKLYGKPAKPIARNPFEWILWENVAYLVDDERRKRAYRELERRVGLTAKSIAKASSKVLNEIAALGGMHPEQRAAKLVRIAELALGEETADLSHVADLPPSEARAVLEKFPAIGRPGADRILLLCGARPSLGLESNGLRVAVRLGYGEEKKSYSSTYRSAIEALEKELPGDRVSFVRAHDLLRAHGKSLCKRNAPDCDACPLTERCLYFARHR